MGISHVLSWFSDKRQFALRPIFLPNEDPAQIICLIVETYNKLAASINVDEHPLSTQIFWEKATVIMTDSVSKNLKISEGTEKFFNPCIWHTISSANPIM